MLQVTRCLKLSLVDILRNHAKAICEYGYGSLRDSARIRLQQVIAIARYRKRIQRPGPLESLAFQSLFPLAGLGGTGQDEVREAKTTLERSAFSSVELCAARTGECWSSEPTELGVLTRPWRSMS